ncbi:MAG TPA: PKD domain-containing protein, partial [Nitrospiria bacterium]|nr:PKD domain-containing protein [Nitrospiria bacterium]
DPLFGPETYIRGPGKPETITRQFSQCEPDASHVLRIQNGREDGSHRLSSVRIHLNGEEVLFSSDLNQEVGEIIRPVALGENNVIETRLASAPEGELTVTIECVEDCFGVSIHSPAEGSFLNERSILVTGSIHSSSAEAGVVSGFSHGYVAGSPLSFAIPEVPLDQGPNTVLVTATNACGMKASAEIGVTLNAPEDPVVILSANPPGGVAPLSVNLHTLAVPPGGAASYAWNFTDETDAELSVTYDTPGLYFPQVTVANPSGETYTATAVVYVLDSVQLDAALKAKWGGMREAMGGGDIEAALGFFTHGSRERYREIFGAIADSLPDEAAGLEDLELITIRGTTAKYRIHRTVTIDNAPRVLTYYVYFIQDGDGIWRIKQF